MITQRNLVLFIIALISVIFINSNAFLAPLNDKEENIQKLLIVKTKEPNSDLFPVVQSAQEAGRALPVSSAKKEDVSPGYKLKIIIFIVGFIALMAAVVFLFKYIRRQHYRQNPIRKRF